MRLVLNEGNDHAVEVEEEHDEVETELGEGFPLVYIQLAEDLGGIQEMSVVNNLLDVVAQERQVEDKRQPVSVDQEHESEESMDGGFGNDVGVEAVAEVDRVDVVTLEIAVHDSEEDLEEEVDGVYNDREEVQPRFARHFAEQALRTLGGLGAGIRHSRTGSGAATGISTRMVRLTVAVRGLGFAIEAGESTMTACGRGCGVFCR